MASTWNGSRRDAGIGTRIAWVGHLEPKKNPMMLLQIAHALHRADPRYVFDVAGRFTDLRTARYVKRLIGSLGLEDVIRFHGSVDDMPAWYADKGVLLSTSMYESFGLNIGEAMAVGAFPVVHDFPGADRLWPDACLFASIDDAVAPHPFITPRTLSGMGGGEVWIGTATGGRAAAVGRPSMMRVVAIGRSRDGPEAELFARYRTRIRPELVLTELQDGKGSALEIKRREGRGAAGRSAGSMRS
jgi:hypothetical protein